MKPRLLIFELRMLGDAVLSLPFIRAATSQYDIFVCCQPAVADVFRTLLPDGHLVLWRPPWLDDDNKYALSKWQDAGLRSVLRQLRAIRPRVAVSVWADARIHLAMALSGARTRIGFPMNPQNVYASRLPWRRRQISTGNALRIISSLLLGRRLLTEKVDRADCFQHHVENWRQLGDVLQLNWSADFPWLSPSPGPLSSPVAKWLENARESGGTVWLLHPGARTPNRRWPLEQFRALLEDTFRENRAPVIVIDPVESPLPQGWLPEIFTYRPRSLPEFFRIVGAVDCVICNDTATAHIAAALGKRVVSIFSAGLPQWFAPYGNQDLVAQSDVCPHRPCLDRCVMPSYVCVENITVEMVRRQIQKLQGFTL